MGLFLRFSLYLSYFIPLYKLKTMDTQTLSCQAEINWLPLPRGKTSFGTWVLANWTRSCYLAQSVFPNFQFFQIPSVSGYNLPNFFQFTCLRSVASSRTIAWLSIFFLGLLVALLLAICPRTWKKVWKLEPLLLGIKLEALSFTAGHAGAGIFLTSHSLTTKEGWWNAGHACLLYEW